MNTKKLLNSQTFERKVTQLKTVAHPARLLILWYLKNNPHTPVHKVAEAVGLPAGIVSIHLNNMRHKDIVQRKRKGKEVGYSVNESVMKELQRLSLLDLS